MLRDSPPLQLSPASRERGPIAPLAPPRAKGEIRASFAAHAGAKSATADFVATRTRVATLYETGGLRLRFPKAGDRCEAVIVNTAGGIVGGDHARLSFEAGPGAALALTTQSAEKIYRTDGALARADVSLTLGAGAVLDWLPQETILFDRAAFSRHLTADVAGDAQLVLCESVVFGRLAMGEQCAVGAFSDRWRISREGRLVFAEDVKLDGAPAALLDRPAIGAGARALATLLIVAPDAEARLEACRAALAETDCDAGASAFNGILVARIASRSPENLRKAILSLFSRLLDRAPPRVWR